MTDQALPQDSVFARAEAGARTVVMTIGLGVMAFFVGGILMGGLSVTVAERFGAVHSTTFAFIAGWVYQRLWLWLVLPAFAWGVARFRPVRPLVFALVSAACGEAFDIVMALAMGDIELVFVDTLDVAARVLTFAFGVWVVLRAIAAGQADAARAQTEADAFAAKQRAEYAEFLARAEAGAQVSSPPPSAPPPPSSSAS
jgi:hypothetical protein